MSLVRTDSYEPSKTSQYRVFSKNRIRLVWRPVAAALAWLERTQDALPANLPQDDFIVVVHLGPDCLEFVPFRLRERQFQGKRYVVPLREPPTPNSRVTLSGCDWAAGLTESTFGTNDPGAFWQAFTGFPEIWEALAQRSWNPRRPPACLEPWRPLGSLGSSRKRP